MTKFDLFLEKCFLRFFQKKFNSVKFTKNALKTTIELSNYSHPYEFFGLLEGKIVKNILIIEDVIFTQQTASTNKVVSIPLLFNRPNYIGTIHSHPSRNNRPSLADKKTFLKNPINIIINYPYKKENITFFNRYSEIINYVEFEN